MRIYPFILVLLTFCTATATFALEESTEVTPKDQVAPTPSQPPGTPTAEPVPGATTTSADSPTAASPAIKTPATPAAQTTPSPTSSTPPEEEVSAKKKKALNALSKMSAKEVAELLNFITTMGEDVSNTPLEDNPYKEKILNSLNKMTPKEMAELLNFITTMEEDVSSTPVEENPHAVPNTVKETLKRIVKAPPEKISITMAPIPGVYEAAIESEVVYVSADGRYLLMGDLRDTQTGRNITEDKRDKMRAEAIKTLNDKDLVVFASKGETKATLNVFTDVDCGYCAKFHQEAVSKLNDAGIKIRYLAFPRAGIGSETYKKMVSVWCAEDPQKAITDAKAGREVKSATCDNTIEQQYELGKKVGVTGTPALLLSTGELIPGYVPPERLIPYLLNRDLPLLGKGRTTAK